MKSSYLISLHNKMSTNGRTMVKQCRKRLLLHHRFEKIRNQTTASEKESNGTKSNSPTISIANQIYKKVSNSILKLYQTGRIEVKLLLGHLMKMGLSEENLVVSQYLMLIFFSEENISFRPSGSNQTV